MIIEEKSLNVKSSGIDSKSFGIKMNSKMFKILSANIYSNPIKSILREVGCNAYDGHVAAGKQDLPIQVHLPNSLEPFLEIKDFGTGIDDNEILEVYTQYGGSNKSGSNDFTGAFGLGSKSPFAYTDNFTVENRRNGKITHYTAYLDENGIPAFSEPLSSESTTEPNGLTVRFPVKAADFTRFAQEASEVFRWFKTKPTVKGSNYFAFPAEIKYLHKYDFYGMPEQNSGSPMIIMGNVCYPINIHNILPNYSSYNYYYKNNLSNDEQNISAVLSRGIILFSNIGDVEVTASREQLSYGLESGETKKTVDYIKKQCLEAFKHLEVELTKSVNNAKDIWEARKRLHKIKYSWGDFRNLKAKWNNQDITETVKLYHDKNPITLMKVSPYFYRKSKVSSTNIKEQFIPFEEDVYEADCHGAVSRIVEEVIKTSKTIYYFPDTPPDAWIKENAIPLKKASDLPPVPKKTVVRTAAQKAKVYKFKQDGNGNLINWWEATEIDLDSKETFIYVNIAFFKFENKNGVLEYPANLANLCKVINALDKNVTIYGIRKSDINYLKKSKGTWVKVFDYIDQKNKELEKLYKERAINRATYLNSVEKSKIETLLKLSVKNDDIKKFIDYYNECKKDALDNKVQSYHNLNNDKIQPKDDLDKTLKTIISKYKVLNCIDWYKDPLHLKNNLEEYFNLVK